MSYEPTEWQSGDVVTSAALNKLEQGVAAAGGGGGVLVVNGDMQTGALNKTVREMLDGMMTGCVVLPYNALESGGPATTMWLYYIEEGAGQYRLEFGSFVGGESVNAFTETLDLDEYPVLDMGG